MGNREIKFRCFNKDHGLIGMVYCLDFNNGLVEVETEEGTTHTFGLSYVELTQYTGLKDATTWEQLTEQEQKEWISHGNTKEEWRGREIYEGDIVLNWHVEWNTGGMGDKYETKVVEFKDGCFINCLNSTKPIEIIGNIYENPELLKE